MLRDAEREYRASAARVLNIVKAIEDKEAYKDLHAKTVQQLLEDQLLLSRDRGSPPRSTRAYVLSQHGVDR